GPVRAELLADDAVGGEAAADEGSHRGFCRAVRRRDWIEAAAATLVFDAERGAEEGQDGFARKRRKLVHERRKIDCRHRRPAVRTMGAYPRGRADGQILGETRCKLFPDG